MKRRGISLVELIVILSVVMVLVVAFGPMMQGMLRDLGQVPRLMATDNERRRALDRLRGDVAGAMGLEFGAGGDLEIAHVDGIVSYRLAAGQFVRAESGRTKPTDTWRVPGASLEWTLWRDADGTAYAIEVRTSLDVAIRDGHATKLANAHVFFPARRLGEVQP
ncbi:MAG: type II secretion system protein [Planctomycetota bacterium]|jgi:hypothetical protein